MRIAFIGGFGHHYLRGLLKDDAFKIDRPIGIAPSAPQDDRAEVMGKALGDIRLFPDAISLLDDFKPEIVSIGGIYGFNGDLAAAALERDIPVVSDKPIAATWEQLKRLRDLTRNNKRILLTEFDFRSRPTFRAARQAILDGKIGQPVLATGQKSYRFAQRPAWYADRTAYAGTMLWVASHAIDAIQFVTGKQIRKIVGRQGNVSREQFGSMEEYCTTLMELDGGGTAIAHADYYRPDRTPTHGDDRLRVAGTSGVVEVRAGRCLLLGMDGAEQDITESIQTRPMHVELMAALRGEETDLYGTQASLDMAQVLLHARDAADQQVWVSCDVTSMT